MQLCELDPAATRFALASAANRLSDDENQVMHADRQPELAGRNREKVFSAAKEAAALAGQNSSDG